MERRSCGGLSRRECIRALDFSADDLAIFDTVFGFRCKVLPGKLPRRSLKAEYYSHEWNVYRVVRTLTLHSPGHGGRCKPTFPGEPVQRTARGKSLTGLHISLAILGSRSRKFCQTWLYLILDFDFSFLDVLS